MKANICVAIPCLNEAATIAQVIQRVRKELEFFQPVILVVDDGSTDSTAQIASQNDATVISHPKPMGVGGAFQTAVTFALEKKFNILCSIDGDGQFDPRDLQTITAPILKGHADVVTGSRFMDNNYLPDGIGTTRKWGNNLVAFLVSRLVGHRFYDVACGLRAYNREALFRLSLFGRFTYTQEVLIDLSFKNLRILEVPIKVQYFAHRESRVFKGIFDYASRSLPIIVRGYRDNAPLALFGGTGLLLICLAAVGLFFFFNYFFVNGVFRGQLWLGLSSAVIMFLGLVSIAIGLILDMLQRIKIVQDRNFYLQKKSYFGDTSYESRSFKLGLDASK